MDSRAGASVELTLLDLGSKWIDSAPKSVRVGNVRLHGWQVDPIVTPPSLRSDVDSYLVKVNFELDLAGNMLPMNWFEVGFTFQDTDQDEEETGGTDQVTVVDAVPHPGFQPGEAVAYTLNQYLHLVPATVGAQTHAYLPSGQNAVDVFGIGSNQIRWRHTSPENGAVRPGSYPAWVVLVVPKGRTEQHVRLSARFDLDPQGTVDYGLTSTPDSFRLTLATAGAVEAVRTAQVGDSGTEQLCVSTGQPPTLFISYAHDDDRHKTSVREFANLLMDHGIDTQLDQWSDDSRKDWGTWASRQIETADFIAVVASPMCRKVGDGAMEPRQHRGLQNELGIIRNQLAAYPEEWGRKVLPVVLPGGSVEDIPVCLRPHNMDHYIVDKLTEAGIDDLLRSMTSTPSFPRPPLGEPATRLKEATKKVSPPPEAGH
ncbi:SEFIR domain-containing protein [Streptomyces sp. NPDC017979]|uniref:SEFIR domain-containing protein n=1 Tax=Streptomyces sp. NPDC017979 TaxID=3365024 RepID=UPI0037901F38